MSGDIAAVAWKEWRELRADARRGGRASVPLLLGVFGVLMPWQLGETWIEMPSSMLAWTWVPMLLVVAHVADMLAGERERHTLETLLSTPVTPRAVVLGKVVAASGYGVAVTWALLVVGTVTVNIAHREGGWRIQAPSTLAFLVAVSVLGLACTAAAGALAAARAASVRQAQQSLGIGVALVSMGPILAFQALSSERRAAVLARLGTLDTTAAAIALLLGVAVLDIVLLTCAVRAFTRATAGR